MRRCFCETCIAAVSAGRSLQIRSVTTSSHDGEAVRTRWSRVRLSAGVATAGKPLAGISREIANLFGILVVHDADLGLASPSGFHDEASKVGDPPASSSSSTTSSLNSLGVVFDLQGSDRRVCRFTPVHTGKRRPAPALAGLRPVHPRAYGEERDNPAARQAMIGSPPCIRGRAANGQPGIR